MARSLYGGADVKSKSKPKLMGRYIVTDPAICHGKPTFRGTRVLVADVLEQVASGVAWDTIIAEWNSSVTKEAIQEAVQLASQALLSHADEFIVEPAPA
jgi:uncharacterized protein (DUF433 family)